MFMSTSFLKMETNLCNKLWDIDSELKKGWVQFVHTLVVLTSGGKSFLSNDPGF